MYTNKEVLQDYQISFPLERYTSLENILFLKIEATGLSPSSSQLYMIGIAYYEQNAWTIEQWFAQNELEERALLENLINKLPNYTHIFHFNGNHFDIPYLTQKANDLCMNLSFDKYQGVDICKRLTPFKNLLGLPDCRQKTMEQHLGINRLDKYTGIELIRMYKGYLTTQNNSVLQLLVQHNYDDIKGMLDILPALAYSEMCEAEPIVTRVEMLKGKTLEQTSAYELLMTLKLTAPLPKKLFAHYDGNLLTAEGTKATIKVPVFEQELKLYYSNYIDYCYVPSMDAAYHKSVVADADESLKKQATPDTCYTRKDSLFLKQYELLAEPFFKKEYKDHITYFEITEEIKTNRKLFSLYAGHIIKTIIHG